MRFQSFLGIGGFLLLFLYGQSESQVPGLFVLDDDARKVRVHQDPLLFANDDLLLRLKVLPIGKGRIPQETNLLIGVINEVDENVGDQLVLIKGDPHGFLSVPGTEAVDSVFEVGFHFEMAALDDDLVGFVLLVKIDGGSNFGSDLEEHLFLFWQAALELDDFPFRPVFFADRQSKQDTAHVIRGEVREKLVDVFVLLVGGVGRRSIEIDPLHLGERQQFVDCVNVVFGDVLDGFSVSLF